MFVSFDVGRSMFIFYLMVTTEGYMFFPPLVAKTLLLTV